MLYGILITLALSGSPDSTKQVRTDKKVIEHQKQLKQVEKKFDDTLKLLNEIRNKKKKEAVKETAKREN